MVDFTYAFPSNLAPIVGQQITLRGNPSPAINARLDLLMERAGTTFVQAGNANSRECDLIAKTTVEGREVGFLFNPGAGSFMSDAGQAVPTAQLRGMASNDRPITFTCVYPGGGQRIGIDRDGDGRLDSQN